MLSFFNVGLIYQIVVYSILIGAPIIIISLVLKSRENSRKMKWAASLKFTTLRILVPKLNEKTPLAAEQMFAALHGIFRPESPYQDFLSFEIASREKYIQFYAHVPTHIKDFVEGQIYSQYPTAEISEVDDYTTEEIEAIQARHLKFVGTELSLTKLDVYPIKTFLNFEVDPLASITGVLSKVEKGEEIWVQMMVKPVGDDWQEKGIGHVKNVKGGITDQAGIFEGLLAKFFRMFGHILSALLSGPSTESKKEEKKEEAKLSGTVETALKGIETKITKLGFETKIRIMALAPDENTARAKLSSTVAAFKQFNVLNLNGFQTGPVTSDLNFYNQYRWRVFMDPGYIFNIEELASIYHLPNISVETPSIVWAGSKKGEPPANLPIEENVTSDQLTIFAKTDFRHMEHKFGIKIPDRRYHMYAIGKTGTGKSTLLENMIIDDMQEGRGLAVVDPHGDLIKHLMEYVPDDRIKDVVFFSPSDRLYPVAFNLLENVDPELKNIVASGVVGIFKKIFGESWGPRLEYILRNTILALLDYPDATLLGITKLLVDQDFRNRVVEKIKDPVIKDFFVNEYEKYDQKFRTEAIAPIQNKVGQFLSSTTIRNIIGQPKSTVNIEDIMNSGKILFVDLSIGEIGEDSSSLLGAMMITKIQLSAMRRTLIPEDERRDFYLYVDEFQNFATESFATILSEARKYRLNLIMTNQYTAQVPEEVMAAVFGNIGTLITFRVGAPDAAVLKQEFAPVFEEVDLVNLDNYHVYVKMSVDGVTSPAFSATTLPRSAQKNNNKEAIINHSREKYSKNREHVEVTISNLNSMPKVDELLTRAQKNKIPKLPPKIGETYYREVQAPGDVRWYFGGGTEDTPLTEEVVQEKLAKAKEDSERMGEPDWMEDRLKALEVKGGISAKKNEEPVEVSLAEKHEAESTPEPAKASEVDDELESDKNKMLEHISKGKSETKHPTKLEEGHTVKIG
jgi:hypothetical protein